MRKKSIIAITVLIGLSVVVSMGNSWQDANDVSVQNDYDGDGMVDIAVWKNTTGEWYIRQSSDLSLRIVQWGQSGDFPVPSVYRR